jgi:hypothetical protein
MFCVVPALYALNMYWCTYPEIGSSSIDWFQLSRFYLKTETEPSIRNVVFEIKQGDGQCPETEYLSE